MCIQWIMFIKFIWAINIVLLLFLSRRTFDTGWSDSMEMDEVPQRRSGLHRQHGPHHERLFLSARRVDRRSCPHHTSEINFENYYLKTFFKITYYMLWTCKVDRRVATTMTMKIQIVKWQPKRLPDTKRRVDQSILYLILWYLILINWFDSLNFPCKKYIVFLEGLWFLPPDESVCKVAIII